MGKYAEIPDLVWGETKSVPCITLPKHSKIASTARSYRENEIASKARPYDSGTLILLKCVLILSSTINICL